MNTDKSTPDVKAICDALDHLRRHTHEPYYLDPRDSYALMGPLLTAATALDKLERRTKEWAAARGAFLALPAGSPDARDALNRLADAENDLYLAVRS